MADLPGTAAARLTQAFERNFQERGEIGASVAVWQGECELFSLAGGQMEREGARPWAVDTLVPVWSATKGPAAVTCLLALESAGLALTTPVAEIWPEFAQGGKGDVQFAHVLSHTAGLFALDQPSSSLDYASVIHALEQQVLPFPAGTQQGYHARTFGFLLDEIVRRATGGTSLGAYFRQRQRRRSQRALRRQSAKKRFPRNPRWTRPKQLLRLSRRSRVTRKVVFNLDSSVGCTRLISIQESWDNSRVHLRGERKESLKRAARFLTS